MDSRPAGKGSAGTLWTIIILIIVIVVGFFLFRSPDNGPVDEGGIDATVSEDGLILGEVIIPDGGGFAVVYENKAGTRTAVGQSALLPAGKHKNVFVSTVARDGSESYSYSSDNSDGVSYAVEVYADTDSDGLFKEGTDEPYTGGNGEYLGEELLFDSPDEAPKDSADTETPDEEAVENDSSESKTVRVVYTDNGFEPSEVTINAGDTVKFVDESEANDMWVATALHPTHTVYPGSDIDKCDTASPGELFDQCGTGESFELTFSEVGEWAYHNHVNADDFGKVIVE